MKILKKGLTILLLASLTVSACFSERLLTVQAAETDNYFEGIGKTDGSDAGIGRADVFTETWEGGLDLDKWEVVKYDSSYKSDFRVVDDPVVGSEQGKVLMSERAGVWLLPTDEYYPSGNLWGELKTVEFKVYLKDINSQIDGNSGQKNEYAPGIAFRAITDDDTGETLCRRVDGFLAYSSMYVPHTQQRVLGAVFYGNSFNGCEGLTTFGYLSPTYVIGTKDYTADFDFNNWISVKITVDVQGNAFASFTDCHGNNYMRSVGKYNQSGGKFAIGYMPRGTHAKNYEVSAQDWGGQMYIDNIRVTFQPSDFDKDESVGDVDVYYEGNTFIAAGDTVSLTGERLGSSVLSAQIARMADTKNELLTMEDAEYVQETHYDAYYDVDANDVWSKLEKGTVMKSTEDGSEFSITQRSQAGLNIIIPKTLEDGMYALLLEAEDDKGKDELVIINNPRITFLMGNDGDYASSDGWLKLGGENLSVQDDVNEVSAIVLDENGNELHLIQNTSDAPERIYVDTTENYGVKNEHYMKIDLSELNLSGGKYKIMVHNGYGGNYGWSMPFDFQVGYELTDKDGKLTGEWETRSANEIWRDMGVFNVLDYGAVGDGEANDTAAIQRAINAAVKNGGGMVYFPKRENGAAGYYRVSNRLDVKQNISFVGDGIANTKLFFDGYLKTTVAQTESFISYESDFELSSMELYCNTNYFVSALRGGTSGEGAGKLYLHDAKIYFDATAWRNNSFTAAMPDYMGKTASEWYEIQWSNLKKAFLKLESNATFILYDNITKDLRGITLGGASGSYADVSDLESKDHGCDIVGSKAGFYTRTSTINLKTNGVMRSPYVNAALGNNVEVFLRDTGGINTTSKFRYIDPTMVDPETGAPTVDEENGVPAFARDLSILLSTCTDTHIAQIQTFAEGNNLGRTFYSSTALAKGDTIAVTDGVQGLGQIRTIEDVTKVNGLCFVTVNEPFACNPNRNNTISRINGKPHHVYVNDGDFKEGNYVGIYGISYDVVFSNCTLENVSCLNFSADYTGFHWYGTINGLTVNGTDYVHNDKVGDDSVFFLRNGESIGGVVFMGMRFANTTLKTNKSKINLIPGNTLRAYNAYNLVVENVSVISENPVLYVAKKGIGGMLVHNVRQYSDETNLLYSEITPYVSPNDARQPLKRLDLWADNLSPEWAKALGDLNKDDVVSVRDLEELQKYFAGAIEFDAEQLVSANLNKDKYYGTDVVDARDFLYLRAIIKFRDNDMELQKAIALIGTTSIPDKDLDYGIILDYDKAGEED